MDAESTSDRFTRIETAISTLEKLNLALAQKVAEVETVIKLTEAPGIPGDVCGIRHLRYLEATPNPSGVAPPSETPTGSGRT